MISATILAQMQATANSAMDKSITIQRSSKTYDATGAYSETWPTQSTVNGNLAQPTGTLLQNFDYLIGPLNTWLVRVPVGTSVLPDDRLVIGSQTLRVMVILQPQSYQTSMRLLAAEIGGQAL